jgi:hypothetical protein
MFATKSRRRSPAFRPTFDALSSRIAPTVFTPVVVDMGTPPLPDSSAETKTLTGDDVPPLPTGA